MAVAVEWSDEAKATYDANIEYLKDAWTDNEVRRFVHRSEYVLLNIEDNPRLYPVFLKSKQIRRAIIDEHITLYYRYYPTRKLAALVFFWNTRQDSKKLKFK